MFFFSLKCVENVKTSKLSTSQSSSFAHPTAKNFNVFFKTETFGLSLMAQHYIQNGRETKLI